MLPWLEHDETVFTRFERVVQAHPGRVAVRAGDQRITYETLHTLAESAAASIDRDDQAPLAIGLPAGVDFIIAAFAALRQGRPYIPFDPSAPEHHRDELIQASGAHDVITAALPATGEAPVPPARARSDSVACVLYTSGSTGRPKGVYQAQKTLLHDVRSYGEAIALDECDVMTWLYAPVTGGAIRDLFGALLHGAELVVMNPATLGLPGISAVIRRACVTIVHAIPPLLRAFLASTPPPESLQTVRMLYVAGDRFFRRDLDAIRRVFPPDCQVYTGLGATECTTLHRHWIVPHDAVVTTDLVPVGFDAPDKHTRIIDPHGNAVAPGETGEIEVTSAYLALGYWQQPELSGNAFRVDPADPARRIYRTGDMGYMLPDGNLVFAGRKDSVIKILGHRVDLIVVEAAIRHVPGILDVEVLVRDEADPHLVAILVGDAALLAAPEAVRTAMVRTALAHRLPSPALPAIIQWCDTLPRLASHKVNRRELQGTLGDDPATVEALWQNAVPASCGLDADRTFANAGGNSLAAMRLHVALEALVGHSLPVGLVHADQTLRGLREQIETRQRARATPKDIPVWFVVGGINWSVPHLEAFARAHAGQLELHPVPLPDVATQGALDVPSLGRHVAHVVRSWREQRGAAVRIGLVGVSLGALIAHEAACILQDGGLHRCDLIVCDLGPSSPQINTALSYRLGKAWRSLRCGERRFTFAWAAGAFLGFALPVRWLKGYTRHAATRAPTPAQAPLNAMSRLVFRSLSRWTPRRYDGTLTLIKPVEGFGKATPEAPADFGWGPYAARVSIQPFPGGHVDLFSSAAHATMAGCLLPQHPPP